MGPDRAPQKPDADDQRQRREGRLGSLVQKSGGWMDKVAGSVKDAARGSLLKQAMEAREPPMSGLPVITVMRPLPCTLMVALDCRPKLNQKPAATPRPPPLRGAP